MINFRAVTGALQMQLRHFNREDLPLLRSFTEERGYRIIEYDAPGIRGIMPNLEYPGDPVVRELLQNRHLRIALSLAIDRELINRLCYGGSGRITPMALHPSAPDFVEVPEAPDHTRYDPERARALLDSIGLDRRDEAGFRLGPDGERVSLILELMVVEGPDMDAVEIVRSQGDTPIPADSPEGCKFCGRCPLVEPRCVEEEPLLRDLRGGLARLPPGRGTGRRYDA